jgi:hypothetical protein
MKRFKIGFLAVVAIVAMSFTVVSHEGLVSSVKVDDGVCDQNVDIIAGTVYNQNCTSIGSLDCSVDLTTPKYLGNFTLQSVPTFECAGGSDVFCCAEASDNSTCSPQATKRITKIICRAE